MKKIIGLFAVVLLLAACGGKKNRPFEEYVSAFLNENQTVVLFGKMDVNTVLTKSNYKSVPKFGKIVESNINEFKKSLEINSPVYFALEGPFEEGGTPETTYAFFNVKNADSLAAKLTEKGYDVNEHEGIKYIESGDVAIGMRNNLAVLLSKKKEFDGKKMLLEVFDKTTESLSEGKTAKILEAKGDIVVGVSYENLYKTSNTDIAKLPEDKQKMMEELATDSYILNTVHFENGALTLNSENLFSPALESRMFFKEDPSASIISKLGSGNPYAAFAMNMDIDKLQSLYNDFAPAAKGAQLGQMGMLGMLFSGKDAISANFSGKIGFAIMGEPNAVSTEPNFNFYVGLGRKSGKQMAMMAKSFLGTFNKVEVTNDALMAYSAAAYSPQPGVKFNVPAGCSSFGKKGLTAFIDFEHVDLSGFDLKNGAKMLELIKYVTIEADNKGGRLYIKAKNGKANVLKQAVDFALKEFAEQISGM